MDTLLSVLMFMNVIVPNGTYNQSYIDQSVSTYSTPISAMESDPNIVGMVLGMYGPEVPSIIIINDDDNEYTN